MTPGIYVRSLFCLAKRLKINTSSAVATTPFNRSPAPKTPSGPATFVTVSHRRLAEVQGEDITLPELPNPAIDEDPARVSDVRDIEGASFPRLPRSVQAIYLKPLKRQAKYGMPSCDLQLRSYSVRNLEFFADFALRAAYYLNLPAAGPIPLPRLTERWTVPRGVFVHKKSQENFERITLRRLIQIQDGHPETIEMWLAFLRKHAYYGIGMKANIWEHEKLGVGKTMDVSLENLKQVLEPKWAHFGRKKNLDTSEKVMEMMSSGRFRQTADGPLSGM
ncbi:mitochondrial 37S ribosomal protein rsm10 [Lignoscripta atroalba]|nr:mitochondrial 37S ribosomal protein rsm10 [Lignoscripta atroalba]